MHVRRVYSDRLLSRSVVESRSVVYRCIDGGTAVRRTQYSQCIPQAQRSHTSRFRRLRRRHVENLRSRLRRLETKRYWSVAVLRDQ